MFRGKSLIFFIPNSCVFSCWSQKTSKWVENITQTHSHSILIGPPTPTWFPFVVSLQARILFASKLISQKLLSFILTIFISHILSSTLRLKIKLQQELLKNFPHNKCLFGNILQKISKWIKSVSLTHSLEFQWPANTYVISGFRFSSERKCIGFPVANVSRARLSFILKRFSSHLCIGRREFSLKNLTLEFSLCFFSYRSRKSGCSCIPSCRFFFFFFGHERVYLCVRPQFKAICDHKQYVCGAIFKQWLDYWCVTDHEIIVGIHKRRASFNDRLPLFNNIRSWRAVLKMMFARFFREE